MEALRKAQPPRGLGRMGLAALLTAGTATAAPAPPNLQVHEWGTFTTLSSSAGNGLSGLFQDASRLPAFVYGLPYFNYDPVAGWPKADKLRHVTVKMETPVLYFYADRETPVEVKVDFRGGTISQWYPQCFLCETGPNAPFVDFASAPYQGHIGWKATVLGPESNLPFTTAGSGTETQEWIAPRNTAANQIRGHRGDIEKFLFYRGIGNFASPLSVAFKDAHTLTVENKGNEDIPWMMIYERSGADMSSPAVVWQQGPLKAHAKATGSRPDLPKDYLGGAGAAMDTLYNHLVIAGLTALEARALLNTWYTGYFIEGGLKVFWIMPTAQIDRILPLEVTPKPDKLVRVMVGRSEILTPEFEQQLFLAEAQDSLKIKYGSDRYYPAYLEFLSHGRDWHMTTALDQKAKAPANGTGNARDRAADRRGLNRSGSGYAVPWVSGNGSGAPGGARNPLGKAIRSAHRSGG
jgi:hypothetical protein